MAPVVHSIAEGGRQETMIDKERGHLHTLLVQDDAFFDVVADHFDAVSSELFVHIAAHVNVKGERPLKVIHHLARTFGPPDLKRNHAPTTGPTSQEQVRNLENMIRVQVCQEHATDRADWHANLGQAKGGAAATVKKQAYAPRLDQCACPELLQVYPWSHSAAK